MSRCPGVTGKKLPAILKALSDRLRPLYGNLDIPFGFANRFCIGATSFKWGGRPGDPGYVPPDQEFTIWTPIQFGPYVFPAEWALESKVRQSSHIETWGANSPNMAKLFSRLYGNGRAGQRDRNQSRVRWRLARENRICIRFSLCDMRGSLSRIDGYAMLDILRTC